jgi:hypothetical protein
MRWALPAAVLAAVTLSSASAYVRGGPGVMPHGHHRLKLPVLPPLDGLVGAASSGAYGFRLLRTGAPSGVRLRRASDNAELDIGFTATGDMDAALAGSHCAATSCFVRSWYDQSGNGRHLGNATAAGQPQLIFNCQNTQPCMEVVGAGQGLPSAANFTPATGVMSLSVVADRNGGTAQCILLRMNGSSNQLTTASGAANAWWWVGGTSGTLVPAPLDGAWHAFAGTLNGASSYAYVDGVATTGSATGSVVAGLVSNAGPATGSCRQAEAVFWDNYALSPTERAALVTNQRNYWGF